MSVPDRTSPEFRNSSIRLPRPLWIGAVAGVLVVAGVSCNLAFRSTAGRQQSAKSSAPAGRLANGIIEAQVGYEIGWVTPRLKSCTSLRRLRIDNTCVTHAGMDDLDRAMPELRIGW